MKTPVGIQLYSVRDGMEKDFEGTLKKVSELGYKGVEFAGFFDHTAEEVKALLDKYGLEILGTHSSFDDLVNKYDETIAYHKIIGNPNYGLGGYDLTTQEKIDRFVELVGPVTEKLKADGLTFTYHNHYQEFDIKADGRMIYEQLIYRTNINFEVDIYWAYTAGLDPVKLMERLGDRVKLAHIKDGFFDKRGMPLGLGEAPVKAAVEYVKAHNIPIVVESETCNPTGLAEAEICINYLKELD